MIAYAAISHAPKGATASTKPTLGTVTLEADTSVSVSERLVNFQKFRVTDAHFSTLSKDAVRDLVAEVTEAIPTAERVIGLDRVLAAVDKSTIVPKDVPGLKSDPPVIFFSQTPAQLVNFDGDPIWSPIEKNDLRFAVNTNWDVFEHPPTKTYYLRWDLTWVKTTDLKEADRRGSPRVLALPAATTSRRPSKRFRASRSRRTSCRSSS